MAENIFYIFIALLVLMFMITVHEFGHYIAGKALGFKIDEFSIGMGPKIFSKKLKSGQIFSIRCLPLGGFCAFDGEDEAAETPNPQAFNNQKPWKRLVVLFAGAFMNFLSAVIIVIIAFSCFGDYLPYVANVYQKADVEQVAEDPSHCLQKDDTILQINGKDVLLSVDVSKMISNAGDKADVQVLRDGKKVLLTDVEKGYYVVRDENGVENRYYGWGIGISYGGRRTTFTFGESLQRCLPYCFRTAGYVLETLGGIVTGLIGLDQIGGPITTIDIASQVARSGFANILMLITLISVNLAVFNLLPIPSLDGSKMIFVLIEWIRGKPLNRKVEGCIHFVGLLLLFGFVILVDLLKLFG